MADGIPYPQAPQYNVTNPLQQAEQMQSLGLRGAEMQRIQQTVEQQEMVNQSKRVIGELAQQAIDPATNELDIHKLLLTAASHPGARLGYMDLAEKALSMGLLDQQRHNAELEAQQKEFEITGRAFAGLQDDKDVMSNSPAATGKIGAALAQAGMMSGKPSDWGTKRYLEYIKMSKEQGLQPSQFVKQAIMGTQSGLAANKQAMENFQQMTEPVTVAEMNPSTGKYETLSTPRSEWGKRQQGLGNLAGGGSAPLAPAGQQEGSPSAPPADRRGILSAAPAGEAEYQQGLAESWTKERSNIAMGAHDATQSMMQIESQIEDLKRMGGRTGSFAPEKLQAAKAALFLSGPDAAAMIMGAKNDEDIKKIIASQESFDKKAIQQQAMALRAALPSDQHSTKEFEKFNNAIASARTTPEGILAIYAYAEKLNNLAIRKAQFLEQYEKTTRGTPYERDAVTFNTKWAQRVAKHPDWIAFEGPKTEGEK